MKYYLTFFLFWCYGIAFSQSNSFVLLENKQNLLPVIDLEKYDIRGLALGNHFEIFYESVQYYTTLNEVKIFATDSLLEQYVQEKLQKINAKPKKGVKTTTKAQIVGQKPILWLLTYLPHSQNNDSITNLRFQKLDSLMKIERSEIVFLHFGKPETLPIIEKLESYKTVLVAQNSDTLTQIKVAQLIFGAIAPKGRLTQTLRKYPQNYGLNTPQLSRLQYVTPQEMGLSPNKTNVLDSIINTALQKKAMAGCQVLVAKDGKVFYHKAFGYHTYDSTTKVKLTDKYDLASITKIAAGTLAVMKLVEEKKLNLDKTLGDYFADFKKSDKKTIILRELYAHQAKLPAGIPTWTKVSPKNLSKITSNVFSVMIADSLYTKPAIATDILKEIKKAPLLPQKQYLYSDLPFILTTFLVKNIAKQNIDSYVNQNFYKSLGCKLLYNPLNSYVKTEIIPTEYDSAFRKQQIHGTVHDETAALLGGVSGHAGLFGSANELAKLMQMYLQKGEYGGKTYLKAETLLEFTRSQFAWEGLGNYRGVGFNRPAMNPNPTGHTATASSQQSFGHSGFTGTYTWADPETGIVYVFLSNRVYPTRKNQTLMDLNTRTEVLQKVYELLGMK
jgi:CubicO group peptidase (beta-lactamase class C family)